MKINIVNKFKVIYLISLGLLLISIFLEWYSFQIYNLDQELIASWQHNMWTEWSTFSDSTPFNEAHRPENLAIPLPIIIIFVGFPVKAAPVRQPAMIARISDL